MDMRSCWKIAAWPFILAAFVVPLLAQQQQESITASQRPDSKVIEIAHEDAPLLSPNGPPAVFILKNGDRIEVHRFTLTSTELTITELPYGFSRFPFNALNWDATLAANSERRTSLQIPARTDQIVIGF
jgi:hypothetical protein